MVLTTDKLPTGSWKMPTDPPEKFAVHKDGSVEWKDGESNGHFGVSPEDIKKAWEALRR